MPPDSNTTHKLPTYVLIWHWIIPIVQHDFIEPYVLLKIQDTKII